jgi:hypothetical protein
MRANEDSGVYESQCEAGLLPYRYWSSFEKRVGWIEVVKRRSLPVIVEGDGGAMQWYGEGQLQQITTRRS